MAAKGRRKKLQTLCKNCGKRLDFKQPSNTSEEFTVVVGKFAEKGTQNLLRSSTNKEGMTFVNAVEENRKYPDFDRGLDANAAIAVKVFKRTYNFVMWFFVRDSWMALLPRWCGTILFVIAILKLREGM